MAKKQDDKVNIAASDFNMVVINSKEYSECVRGAIEAGTNLAVFGRRGSGKTEVAKQGVAETTIPDFKMDDGSTTTAREVYINLSVAERTDMGGYPDMFGLTQERTDNQRNRFVNFVLPSFFKHMIEGDKPVVAVLDEVDKADPSIWAPLLEILQFRSINHRPLKNLRCCLMTGNLISEGSVRPSLPLLDRAEKYKLEPDTDSWLTWAGRSGKIHPSITAFLNEDRNELFGSGDAANIENYADPSPRGWYYASQVLFEGERLGWSKELMQRKVAGFVGKKTGIKYEMYFNHYHDLVPLVDRIFRGESIKGNKELTNPSKELYASMMACSRLSGILDQALPDKNDKAKMAGLVPPKELAYVGKFLQNVAEENVLVAVRTQMNLTRLTAWGLDNNKDWNEFLFKISDQVNGV